MKQLINKIIEYAPLLARGYIAKAIGKVEGGKHLMIGKRVNIAGPGSVIVGNKVLMYGNLVSPCTPHTRSKSAVISIGDRTSLGATRISCVELVQIGSRCRIADARIMDHDSHGIQVEDRNLPLAELPAKPVIIEDSVWVGIGVIILKGVTIGSGSVIGAGSVVAKDIPSNVIAAGNPCKVIKQL